MTTLIRDLADAAATDRLGAELSLVAKAGTAILLSGDLGAGKTALARAIVRALADDAALEVPSPTFTLVQTYDTARVPTAHADLYRIGAPEELRELGLDDLLATHLLIVEWPDRLSDLPEDRLEITLTTAGPGRQAQLTGHGAWVRALSRLDSIQRFLPRTTWAAARRTFLEGDASFRRYERLHLRGRSAVLMDMPARPDGPPVRDGKSYSMLAGLAENIRSVLAINAYLRDLGFSAPETFAFDSDEGLAIIEDLGSRVYGRMMMTTGVDMTAPQAAAVRILAAMANHSWPGSVAVPGGGEDHRLPAYDRNALGMEIELLLDWFWPFARNGEADAALREEFLAAWAPFLAAAEPATPVWVLRDYHSPNLLWLPERRGNARVGLIDTQDAVMGHPAYDLVSLLQDARVDIPPEVSAPLLDYYCTLRRADPGFDETELRRAFAILGAQRATKILGIFARLSRRDGKHGYLRHVPRVSRYLEANLQHPHLAPLKAWYDRHLPQDMRDRVAS